MNFLRDYKDPDEEKKPKGIWDFDEDFDFEDNLVALDSKLDDNVIWCCHKDVPHDESIKFILKADAKNLDTVLFQNRKPGKLIQLNEKSLKIKTPNIFDKSWLIGRNLEIQKLVEMLTTQNFNRLIKVHGPSGCSKNLVSKMAVKYCIERNYFRDGSYCIEANMNHNCQSFMNSVF